ncbi:MAG: GNAT family N-acetyltransferase [Chloroflexi bacterium OHK40]
MNGWHLYDPTAPEWPAQLARLYQMLGPGGAAPVPAYFVRTTFVKMGGRLVSFTDEGRVLALGLLFPRAIEGGRRLYTLRLQQLGPLPSDAALLEELHRLIAPARALLYRPADDYALSPSHYVVGDFDVGAPEMAELAAIRQLYGAIWGVGDEEGYPDDLHSATFGPGTSLVARRGGDLAGFLLGFYRFGLAALEGLGLPHRLELGIESQVMGVAPAFRRSGLAALLKRTQARQALDRGIDLVHWTADPLQYPNAALNFGRLRAVAGEFTRSYYPFVNALNRVPASRLGISWLLRSARGRAGLEARREEGRRDLGHFPGCVVLNAGPLRLAGGGDAPAIAIEIPANWTALQSEEPALAAAWRETTDAILAERLGFAAGQYVVTDAAADGERRFLVAERYTPDLLV